jgi:hypothetical protein
MLRRMYFQVSSYQDIVIDANSYLGQALLRFVDGFNKWLSQALLC